MWKPLIMSFDQKTLALLNVNRANPLTQRFAATTSPVLLNFHKLSPPMQDVKNKDLCCIVISSQKAAFPLISHENTHTHLGVQQIGHLQLPSFSLASLIATNRRLKSNPLFEWALNVSLGSWHVHAMKNLPPKIRHINTLHYTCGQLRQNKI